MTIVPTPTSGEEQESDPMKMSLQISREEEGRISRGVLSGRPTMSTFSPAISGYFFTGGNNDLFDDEVQGLSPW